MCERAGASFPSQQSETCGRNFTFAVGALLYAPDNVSLDRGFVQVNHSCAQKPTFQLLYLALEVILMIHGDFQAAAIAITMRW